MATPTAEPAPAPLAEPQGKSYGQVLKSSALIGGSLGLNAVISVLRGKAMAVLLGPEFYGLFGLYSSITDTVRGIAGMGINSSGVREIAESTGSGDTRQVALTVTTLRRVALFLGGSGALLLVIFSPWVSQLTFNDREHTWAIAILGLAVMFGEISAAQGALLQGMRRIADLARFNFYGALYGAISSVIIIYFFRERGVVPSLVCLAATNIMISWWYARKVKVERVALSPSQTVAQASELLKLGVAFMSSGLAAQGALYFVRVIVNRKLGLVAVGCYQGAWTLAGQYVLFILQAMGADFFPRICAVAKDNHQCNRLVNEQAEVGVLIAVPGLLATISFAPVIVMVLLSPKFMPAVEVLRWMCLGMVLRVISWPMGSIILAKGQRKVFMCSELLINAIYLVLVWAGVQIFGLAGTGGAFFGMYVVYGIGIYLVVRRASGFKWSLANKKLALIFAPIVAAVFGSWYLLPHYASIALGAVVTMLVGIFSLKTLCKLIPFERLPGSIRKLLKLFRMAP